MTDASPPQQPEARPSFDNETEACRHCPVPEFHPRRIGGELSYGAVEQPLPVDPALTVELTEVAAAMLRAELVCVKGHRADKSEHVHFDDVHRWGQRLARVASALRAAPSVPLPVDPEWPHYRTCAVNRGGSCTCEPPASVPLPVDPEPNHYEWFMPDNPTAAVDEYLDDFEAKMREALTDVYVHDMAQAVLPLIAAYREARASVPLPVDPEGADHGDDEPMTATEEWARGEAAQDWGGS